MSPLTPSKAAPAFDPAAWGKLTAKEQAAEIAGMFVKNLNAESTR